jgi:hypothetical protein
MNENNFLRIFLSKLNSTGFSGQRDKRRNNVSSCFVVVVVAATAAVVVVVVGVVVVIFFVARDPPINTKYLDICCAVSLYMITSTVFWLGIF